jgi:hypothetical protein
MPYQTGDWWAPAVARNCIAQKQNNARHELGQNDADECQNAMPDVDMV